MATSSTSTKEAPNHPDSVRNHPLASGRPGFSLGGFIPTAITALVIGWALHGAEFNLGELVHDAPNMWRFLASLFPPDLHFFLDQDHVIQPTISTIQLAVVGTSVAVVLAFPLSILAARNLAPPWLYQTLRSLLSILRAIPEFIWAIMFVSAVGLGVFAGTLALVAGSVGSLSKVFAESIEAIDPRPVEALEAVGARQVQAVSFAVLPQALPNLVSYIMLNFEHNIRASFIVGFVGGGGLGFEVQTETGIFKYHQFLDHLIIIIVLVVLADRLSAFVRKRLV